MDRKIDFLFGCTVCLPRAHRVGVTPLADSGGRLAPLYLFAPCFAYLELFGCAGKC
jgi:hypothetical protein